MTFEKGQLLDHSPYKAISTIDETARRGTREAMSRVLIVEPGDQGSIHEFFEKGDPLVCPESIDDTMAKLLATLPKKE